MSLPPAYTESIKMDCSTAARLEALRNKEKDISI